MASPEPLVPTPGATSSPNCSDSLTAPLPHSPTSGGSATSPSVTISTPCPTSPPPAQAAPADAAAHRSDWAANIVAAVAETAISLIDIIATGSILFTGILRPYQAVGIQHSALGVIIVQLLASCFGDFRTMVVFSSAEALVFSKSAVDLIAARMEGADPAAIAGTALAALSLMCVASGALCLLLSCFRPLMKIPNYFPGSIFSGLFGAIGWLLISFSFSMTAGRYLQFDGSSLFGTYYFDDPLRLVNWASAVVAGAVLFALKLAFDSPAVLPLWCAAVIGVAQLALRYDWLSDDRALVEETCFLAKNTPEPLYTLFQCTYSPHVSLSVIFDAEVLTQLLMGALLGPVLNTSINFTVIEQVVNQSLDESKGESLARNIRLHGVGMVISGFLTCYPANVAVACCKQMRALGQTRRFACVLYGALLLVIFLVHPLPALVQHLPLVLPGAIYIWTGLEVMYGSLWLSRSNLRLQNLFAAIVLVLGVFHSILSALVVGFVLETTMVMYRAAMTDLVKNEGFGTCPVVNIFRPPAQRQLLRLCAIRRYYALLSTPDLFYAPATEYCRGLRSQLGELHRENGRKEAEDRRFDRWMKCGGAAKRGATRPALERVKYLMIDFTEVERMDETAAQAFIEFAAAQCALGRWLTFSGVSGVVACRLEAALGDTRIAQFRMFERIEEGALWLEERQLAVHGLAQSDRAAGLHKWTKAAAPVRGLRAFSKLKPVDSAKEVARGHFMKQPGACGVRSFHPGDTICRPKSDVRELYVLLDGTCHIYQHQADESRFGRFVHGEAVEFITTTNPGLIFGSKDLLRELRVDTLGVHYECFYIQELTVVARDRVRVLVLDDRHIAGLRAAADATVWPAFLKLLQYQFMMQSRPAAEWGLIHSCGYTCDCHDCRVDLLSVLEHVEDREDQRFLQTEPSCVVEAQPSVRLARTARRATLVSHPTFRLRGHVANRGPNTPKGRHRLGSIAL